MAAATGGTTRVDGPAVALLELESIARGMVVADAVVKRAQVHLAMAEPVSPGKYLLLFHGGVAEVEEAYLAGIEAAGASLLDKLFLPQAALAMCRALEGQTEPAWGQSVGIVEAHTVAATLLSLDTALKRAEVRLMGLQLARGIGGKGWYTLTGELDMVQAALEGAVQAIAPELLQAAELLHQPHPELKGRVF
jgi:microcompartment protein CcmL/EutN